MRLEIEKRILKAKADEEKISLQKVLEEAKKKSEAKILAERKEKELLEELLKNQIECPKCHHKFQIKK